MVEQSKDTQHSKVVKISKKAFSVLEAESKLRKKSNNERSKLKDVASDLIILGFEKNHNNQQSNLEDQTILHLINLKHRKTTADADIIELVANCIYWEHIKLALSKGFSAKESKEHVHQFLTSSANKQNLIGLIENYINSFSDLEKF